MKKKIVVMLSLVLCLMLSISLAACSNNKHEAKSEWKFDTAQHWHECATKGHDDKLDVADHTWNDGEVTTEPTYTADGVKTFTCTVCGAKKTESVPKLTHTHTYATEWSKDETNHWHAATCAHTDEKSDLQAHTFGGWTTKTAAGFHVNKVEQRKCSVCEYTEERTIDNTQTHEYENIKYDATNHWFECSCGDKTEIEEHKFGEWKETKPATEAEMGEKERVCSVCDYKETAKIPELGHVHSYNTEVWKSNGANHWHECACGDKTDVTTHTFGDWNVIKPATETETGSRERLCSACGYKETAEIPMEAHTHKFATEWTYDETNHWHASTCGHEVKEAETAHTFNDGVITKEPTETAEGVKTYTCTVCGATKTESVERLPHTHTFDMANWEKNDTHHWHKATCEHTEEVKDKAAHTWNDGVITKEPTETAEGVKTYTCTVCGGTKTESVPKLTHTHTFDTANWETSDTHHWHKATCGHTDEKSGYEEHKGDWTEKTPAGYGVNKVEERTCTVCKKHQERTVENSALAAKDNTVTVGTIDFTYNAKSQPIDSLITAGNKTGMFIKYVGVDGTTYEESTTAPTNAGTYQYTITIPATAEWKVAEASGKFTIAKYELTVLYEKTHTTKEYDGNAMILVEYKSLEGTDVNIIISMKSKDVGAEINRIQLPGLLKDNYTYDQSKVKAEITPKKLNGLEFSVKMSEIDEDGGETDIEREIDGIKGEKINVIITFSQSELYNEGYLDLSTDGSLSGTCKISFKTETGNYVFEREGMKGIGELKLVEDVSGIVAEGDFVEGATVEASKLKVTDDNYTAAITKIENKDYDKEKETAVYDISLVKDNAKVQPNGKVKITMPAPFESETGYVTYHISGENVEELETTSEGGKISFETESFSYFIVVGKIGDNAPAYTLVDKNGKEDANGGYVLFGSYPQTAVKETALQSALAQKAGVLPENGNNGKWTSYKYYYGKKNASGNTEATNETDFMWYIDVEHGGEKYRGVYFTYYRPNAALGELQDDSATYIDGKQKSNGYKIGELYWFKYEPILWQIVRTESGKAQLLCVTAIDSQAYTLVTKKSEKMITDEKDTHYMFYNDAPGVPQNTLATNYEYSAIRAWLNGSFYQNAFDSKQKNLISETLLDNKSGEVGANTTDKVFVPSIAELADVKDFNKKVSDYAKSQGVATSYPGTYCWFWYTRDTYYVLRFQDKGNLLSYDKDRYKEVCGVENGILYGGIANSPCSSGVSAASCGVVPSLWITL